MKINIREVVKDDYNQIKELHKKFDLKILNESDWSKFWSQNPYFLESKKHTPVGWVIEDNNRVVGYLGNLVKEYYYKKEKIIIAFLHGWVVDTKYRLEAVLLFRKFFNQENIQIFMNTTANEATANIWSKNISKKVPLKNFQNALFVILDLEKFIYSYFEYKKINISKFIKKIIFYFFKIFFSNKISRWKKLDVTSEANLNSTIDKKFDQFWKLYKADCENYLLLSRTTNWIKWHFQKKIDEDNAWIISLNDNNQLLGYAVCSDTSNNKINLKRISIVDLVSLGDNEKIYLSLMKKCILEAKKRNYHTIEFIGYKNLKRKIFSKFKPFKRKLAFPFFYKSKNQTYENFLKKDEIWDPSLIDGDAFL
jgi:hypothetical protein|tara:strand:+ start:148 stop:1245 length:1098 start_codon:yes stop_codon:yes gene_type:complete